MVAYQSWEPWRNNTFQLLPPYEVETTKSETHASLETEQSYMEGKSSFKGIGPHHVSCQKLTRLQELPHIIQNLAKELLCSFFNTPPHPTPVSTSYPSSAPASSCLSIFVCNNLTSCNALWPFSYSLFLSTYFSSLLANFLPAIPLLNIAHVDQNANTTLEMSMWFWRLSNGHLWLVPSHKWQVLDAN